MLSSATADEKLSAKVIRAVAAYQGVKPNELEEPLYDVIDLEALDSLFTEKHDGNPRSDGLVAFTYGDYKVTVHSDGQVTVDVLTDA